MPKIKLEKSIVQDACISRIGDKCGNDYAVHYTGEWIDDGKYSQKEIILLDNNTGKYYQYWNSRTGSYFTYYYYSMEDEPDMIELTEVEPVQVTITEWQSVKE